jgi:transposase InsO family protein
MPNESPPRATPSAEALFRFGLVSSVRAAVARGCKLSDAVGETAARTHRDLTGSAREVSKRTLYRWLRSFERAGFAGLQPEARSKVEHSVVLPRPFIDFLESEKGRDRDASVPELIRRAREFGTLAAGTSLDRTTVYRECKRLGLYLSRRKHKRAPDRDTRRFEYASRMQMCLCDGKHFRAGAARRRRVALVFLDDASRYGLHGVVATSENTEIFLRGLYEKCCHHGCADGYFLDGGPGFSALDTAEVIRKLSAILVHGEANYPEGHGKIERFNQTLLNDLLRNWDGRPDIDPDPRALELRLQHYLRDVYNHRPHESLDGRSPHQRFHADPRPLRFAATQAELRLHFVLHIERTVSNDHVVSLDSVDYEVPTGYARQRVMLYRNLLEQTISFLHQGRLMQLHPVDLAHNAIERRARHRAAAADAAEQPPPKSAADIAFERDFRPAVSPDGDFIPTHEASNREDNHE